MKYIRTKDKIYERLLTIRTLDREDNETEVGVINDKGQVDEILAQADTIGELIDGWIVECPEWEKPTFKKQLQYMNWQDYVKTANKHKATHYACIFVKLQNGAIRIEPVAKMNDKGELKLI